jgi:predicted acetyltransferase
MSLTGEHPLQVIIQTTDSMEKDLENEINHLDYLAFAINDDKEEDFNDWAIFSTWYVVGRLGSKLVSHIGIVDRTIRVGGQRLSIAGITGVATHPDFHRRGFTEVLLTTGIEQMHKRGPQDAYDFAMLFCSNLMISYYTKRGFCQVQNPVHILESGKWILFEGNKMVMPLSGKPWPEGEVDVDGRSW